MSDDSSPEQLAAWQARLVALRDEVEAQLRGEADLSRPVELDQAIAQGTFGACLRCGAPIPPSRLEIRPEAPLCVRCQAGREA